MFISLGKVLIMDIKQNDHINFKMWCRLGYVYLKMLYHSFLHHYVTRFISTDAYIYVMTYTVLYTSII